MKSKQLKSYIGEAINVLYSKNNENSLLQNQLLI